MRLFIAVDLSEPVRARVTEAIAQQRATVDAKWVDADKLHLTLVFFGDATPQRLDEIIASARPVAARYRPFALTLDGAGTFGTDRLPKVLWVGAGGALEALHSLATELATTMQVVSEHAEYRPHLTIARAQARQGDAMLGEVATRLERRSFGEWVVDHFTVYESAGGKYRVRATIPLG